MYFVMSKKTNETLFMTKYHDLAKKVAVQFVEEECVVQWSAMSNLNNEENENYYDNAEKA